MIWAIGSTLVFAFMATLMIFVRMKAAERPTSVKRIILPPIFMATGAWMFFIPMFRIEWIQVAEAFVIGMLFSIILIKLSKFEIRGNDIYMKPSRAFPFILFGLLILRIILKIIVGSEISVGETTGMFFILALGMIGTWRIGMLVKYLQIRKKFNIREEGTVG